MNSTYELGRHSARALKPYPAYKDSGVAWLGEVPEHWNVRRMKTLLRERSTKGFPDKPLLAATQTKGVVRKDQYENRTMLALKDLHLLKLVRVGDFVISLRSFQGGIEYAREQGIISPAYTILYPVKRDNHAYLACVFKSKPYIENLSLFVTGIRQGQNIDYENLSRSLLPCPPLPEQAAIVRFLDHAARRIRRHIRAQQQLIALLEEQRQAIIHQAVTGQIDVRTGRRYAAYRPSGVEWLGEVPEHWEVKRLRQCGKVAGGVTPSMDNRKFWDGAIPWITPKDMKREAICDSSIRVAEAAIRETSLRLIDPPAVLMVVRGMILARRVPIAWITGPVTINQDMKALMPVPEIDPEFMARVLASAQDAFVPLIDEAGHGTRRLPTERWRDLAIAIPPRDEQEEIIDSLKISTHTTVATIDRTYREIVLLREYRTRLIADVVTGKLDVREAAARLPDEVEELEPLDEADALIDGEEEPTDALATAP